ncbi:type IV toxin-antitoxin system AbiEi family antitoxin domain-containing protein [Pseudonocardia sp. ICBG1293]|uniref:type IV toxin-antitoxin system AbiEi family antitoxin domain-containing protein n=1 Tax=Pseudonocardia sp. ICBG1293 TaxID=2844382 RepID=UPI001CC94229|nr:type IV toxin-antitoxin system AbiEi family antitoxin domain-containing protein [Pseudonocardia sp. ICBG1293]
MDPEPRPVPAPVLRRDLLASGVGDEELRRLRTSGRLVQLRRGAYVGAGDLAPEERHRQTVRAAVRTLSPDAVFSHVSAAAMHGIGLWRVPLDRVEVTRNRRSGARTVPSGRFHAAALAADEITVVDGVPVTTVPRTVVDLARALPFVVAVAVADAALHAGAVTVEELAAAVARSARRPGTPAARRVLAAADGGADGPGETRSRLLLHSCGLPAPATQHGLRDPAGRFLGRVDFWWQQARVAGEFDGRIKYGRGLHPAGDLEEVLWQEKLREDAIRAEGVAVVRWVWGDLRNATSFAPTVARLERALDRVR